jgi:hypothetical protein
MRCHTLARRHSIQSAWFASRHRQQPSCQPAIQNLLLFRTHHPERNPYSVARVRHSPRGLEAPVLSQKENPHVRAFR